MPNLRAFPITSLVVLWALSACDSLDSTDCSLLDCDDGISVSFNFQDEGAYVFDVTVDGAKTTCRASLPFSTVDQPACDGAAVSLPRPGGNLQALVGLDVRMPSARSITVRATREGQLLGESSQTPAYRDTPGPNGPQCSPASCRRATMAFP